MKFLTRLPIIVATVLVVSFLSFLLLELTPGDTAQIIAGENATKEEVLRDFVHAYRERREIKADWLILSPENISADRTKAAPFYRAFLTDSRISWIAAFRAPSGKMLWLGEVKPGGPGFDHANVYDEAELADLYTERYDRITFLKRYARSVFHY